MIQKLIFLCFLICANISFGQVLEDTLYFNAGNIQLEFPGPSFPYKALNEGNGFDQVAARIRLNPGDSLKLYLKNNDNQTHQFRIRNTNINSGPIPPGAMQFVWLHFPQQGIYQYYDDLANNEMLGLSGMVLIWPSTSNEFFWNLREHQSNINSDLLTGIPFDPDTFAPNYFTINERTHPSLQSDSLAVVKGNVGDTIRIFTLNSGQMDHSIHFHGYHVVLEYSSADSWQVGWNKDSIPIKVGEGQIYFLVPHQDGTFPVHDHNLVATTIGGNSPGGMLVLISIDP